MQITRTEVPTGTEDRTRRETIVPLNTGTREVEPEMYLDCSESEGWPWSSLPAVNTWSVQIEAVRGFIVPFEVLDSQAAAEQAGGDDDKGGVYCYPFSNAFLPIGDGDDDGDLNSSNFDEKMTAFATRYFGSDGLPRGGTEAMTAILAGDDHFMGEFRDDPRDERPVRARVMWTDGKLNDARSSSATSPRPPSRTRATAPTATGMRCGRLPSWASPAAAARLLTSSTSIWPRPTRGYTPTISRA